MINWCILIYVCSFFMAAYVVKKMNGKGFCFLLALIPIFNTLLGVGGLFAYSLYTPQPYLDDAKLREEIEFNRWKLTRGLD